MLALVGVVLPSGCAYVARVSVDSAGIEGTAESKFVAISADGRFVAFRSDAPDLVAGDTNGVRDAFVRDLVTGVTTRVSVDSSGVEGNGHTHGPAISADGRFVAFGSKARNLVPGDTNAKTDVFVHDTLTATTTRVSVDSSGGEGNGRSDFPSISADGRFVAFESDASDLVAGDTNLETDVFLHDTHTGTTTRVSVSDGGAEATSWSVQPAISADGTHVAFRSLAPDLVPGDTSYAPDVFVRDVVNATTSLVSADTSGGEADSESARPSLSTDGDHIAFFSYASDLVPGDTNGRADIFVRDTVALTTTRVSVDSSGTQADHHSFDPSISADGRYVAYSSRASNLVPGDVNHEDVFVHDLSTSTTTRVSLSAFGTPANSESLRPAMSADGRYVAFHSFAENLVGDDTNFVRDVFVRGFPQPTVAEATPSSLTRGTTTTVTLTGTGFVDTPVVLVTGSGGQVTTSNVAVVSETRVDVDVTVAVGAAIGGHNIILQLPGTGPGLNTGAAASCEGCLTITG